MRLSDLLCRFAWYRRLRGGTWHRSNKQWCRVSIEVFTEVDFSDDFSVREDFRQFLAECEKEGQRERS